MSQDGREGLGWHCEFRREEETDNPRPRVNFITDFDGTASDALEGVAGQDEAEQPVSGTSASILRECEEGVPDLGECLVERSTSLPHSRARGEIRAMMERLVAECREATAAAIRSCVVEKSAEGVTGDSSAQETRQSLGSEVEIVEATSRDETVLARVDIFDRGSNSTCRIPLPNAHLSFGYYDEDSGAEGIVPGCEDVVAGASERDGFLLGGYYGECDVSAVVEGKSSVIIRVTFVPQSGQSIEPSSGDYRILGFVTAYDDGATQPVTPQ